MHEKKPVLIDKGLYDDITDYQWSPDSHWVTYAKSSDNRNHVIYLYSLDDRKSTPVTTSASDSTAPYFDPEGKYLYFLSNRDFNEVLGVYDLEFANPKAGRVYIVTLRADEPSPLPVLSDEVTTSAGARCSVDADSRNQKPPEPPPAPIRSRRRSRQLRSRRTKPAKRRPKAEIAAAEQKPGTRAAAARAFASIWKAFRAASWRCRFLPDNLQNLTAAKGIIFYVVSPIQGLSGPLPGEPPALHAFDLKDRKDHVLLEGADQYVLSFDGKKILYAAPKSGGEESSEEGGDGGPHMYGIIDAKVPPGGSDGPGGSDMKSLAKVGDGALKLDTMTMEVDPPAEWKQIFNEVWRQERDYFFEASMNGVNWEQERTKYAQLLPYVADRLSLTYILGEMIGELSNSHTYVGGGDYPDIDGVNVGLLGADFAADTSSGMYRIAKIYPGENWNGNLRSPLTEPGVLVKEGDYLLAVNGRQLRIPQNPDELFINTVNQAVTLTVNSKPTVRRLPQCGS